MKYCALVVLLFAVIDLEQVASVEVPPFAETLQNLHRGPPLISLRDSTTVQTKWITQYLDHFDLQNQRTWRMRYMVNEEHFLYGGPIFIYVGGEWEISSGAIVNGILPDLAREHRGILFYTEHRYYGASKPTSDLSIENLQYLHVKQSLADLAHFIRTQRKNDYRLANSRVIIAGCSYSAAMVVWFSELYPQLVHGGFASSAPIMAQVDFKEYYELVGKVFEELGYEKCYRRIKNGIAQLEAMFTDKRIFFAKSYLQLCYSFNPNNDLDLFSLFSSISNVFAGIAQYQSEGTIPFHCDNIMSFPNDLAAISTYFVNAVAGGRGCVDATYRKTLAYMRNPSYTVESRAWIYQTCNEFGWFQSSSSREQPFGTKFPVHYYTKLCDDIFDRNFTYNYIHEAVTVANKALGGLNPAVRNVYMTQGGSDPWSAMGQNATHGATVIPRASHCADLGSISSSDSIEMRASKQRFIQLVRKWLA